MGGLFAGWFVDRYSSKRLLVAFAVLSAIFLFICGFFEQRHVVIVSLALIGFSYGAIIAIYPVAIAKRFKADGPKIYGKVFVSWGMAGLSAPWFAGWIFDQSSDYSVALLVASCISILAAVLTSRIKWQPSRTSD